MRKSRFFILLPVIALLVNVFSVSNVFGVKYGDVNGSILMIHWILQC